MRKYIIFFVLVIFYGCNDVKDSKSIGNAKIYVLDYNKLKLDEGLTDSDSLIVPVEGDSIIPFQLDDFNGDNAPDEITFISLPNPSYKKISKDDLPEFDRMTGVTFYFKTDSGLVASNEAKRIEGKETTVTSKHFQFEGPAWENDKVGFRNYFDERNGMDIFGKTVGSIVFDTAAQHSTYHKLGDWGMDILKVGNSFGAGAIGLKIDDTIINIGSAEDAGYKLICEGPIRTIFDLYYKGIKYDSNNYNVIHRISIFAGEYCYRSEVTIEGLKGGETLVTGIVNMHSDTVYEERVDDYIVYYTHSNQAFDGEKLGMALLAENAIVKDLYKLDSNTVNYDNSYCMDLSTEIQPIKFRFYAGWELSDSAFSTSGGFLKMIKNSL